MGRVLNQDSQTAREKNFCWLSGMQVAPENWHGPWHLQIAHIASGSGVALRVDDRRAVIMLSPLAHQLHVSDASRVSEMTIGGVVYPTIDERHTIWIKKKVDPEYYDRAFLHGIWIGRPPEAERPPDYWCEAFYNNTGICR